MKGQWLDRFEKPVSLEDCASACENAASVLGQMIESLTVPETDPEFEKKKAARERIMRDQDILGLIANQFSNATQSMQRRIVRPN